MHRRILIVFFLLTQYALHAQLYDDFSDGDLTMNPAWSGDVGDFIVNGGHMLQLNAPDAGTSFIHTPLFLADSCIWEFWYRMEFAPSATNKMRVYLMLDTNVISEANGYFLEIGENGSTDALHVFRLDNGNVSEIASSEGLFGGDPSSARIQIQRNAQNLWSVKADLTGGENYQLLFNFSESSHPLNSAEIFGIECTYTATRTDLFFFDEIFAGLPAPDTTPAMLTQIIATDPLHIVLEFDESLDPLSALDITRYTISAGIGLPATVVFADIEQRVIELTLPIVLQPFTDYALQISGLQDLAGNETDTIAGFQYIEIAHPQPYDILINEIMADPSPPLGLPNAEYLELYNRSEKTFQLENFALTVGSLTVLLPEYILPGNTYVLVVDIAEASLFGNIQNLLAIDLPTLTNSGTSLDLTDDTGIVLHQLSYDLNSYQDASRDDGGWSLELINPNAPCRLDGNLRASLDLTGGTPGRSNSVLQANQPDNDGPLLVRVFPESPIVLHCLFDEVITSDAIEVILEPTHAFTTILTEDNVLEIVLQTPLQSNTLYTLSIHHITDCIGNAQQNQVQTFALPVPAEEGDVFINELLFDPGTGGSRFIEVFNVSNKFIDLSELIIADIQGDTIAAHPVATSFLCHPGTIVAITPDPQDIMSRYFMHDDDQIIASDLPSFNRTTGNATIYTRSGIILDAFDYSADYHNALLDDVQGVSLERISPNLETQSPETWYSAASTAGYATPGLPNSQRLPDFTGNDFIVIEPEIFSPDNDGTDDFLTLRFTDPAPGTLASVRVFDSRGREVARLAENVSIGTDALLRWDGIDSNGDRARIGPYVLWIELFNPNGNVEHYKRTCVLAERL